MTGDIQAHDSTKLTHSKRAPGRPGIEPRWNTGAKTAVGTSVPADSRIWFTIAHGHLNEIYFPDVDRANTRFVRFVVAGANGLFSDEATDTDYSIRGEGGGIPLFHIESRCKRHEYRLLKEVVVDPDCDSLLLRVRFEPAKGFENVGLYIFANPHMGDQGEDNSAWAGEYKGIPMLFAARDSVAMAIACSSPFESMHCGFLGKSDGMEDLRQHGRILHTYTEAEGGNVALLGKIDWRASDGEFRVAIAFGGRSAEAALQARASLSRKFEEVRRLYISGWEQFHSKLCDLSRPDGPDLFRTSAAVCRIHESGRFPGAFVASLSIPWGFARGDKATGGYHVLWPRDLCETAAGLLACGDADSARRALFYLECTQDADGHWNQNQWLDGTQHWTSRQMDENSFPILLADSLRRSGALDQFDAWAMVRRAAAYLACHGPVAQEDRWESVGGYAVFTMAVEVAALLAAADFADLNHETQMAAFLRATADAWNEAVDELTYVTGTDLAAAWGVDGYYVRVMPPDAILGGSLNTLAIKLRNHPKGEQTVQASRIPSPDALALVRFGLRAADDPRMLETVKVIDGTLKVMTKTGPIWRRYVDDGYGEHEDGAPFNGSGIGRGWPLLTGERAHYEVARGNFEYAETLRCAIDAQTSECGLIPEQIWDAPDIPDRELFNGRPSGSGMPLVWAHAEYIKLLRSLRERKIWDIPPQTVERYINSRTAAQYQIWTREQQRRILSAGRDLRVDCSRPAAVEWTSDDWTSSQREATQDSGLGVYFAVLPVRHAPPRTRIRFRVIEHERGFVGGHEHQVVVKRA